MLMQVSIRNAYIFSENHQQDSTKLMKKRRDHIGVWSCVIGELE